MGVGGKVSTGRGGAGNIGLKSDEPTNPEPMGTPTLKSKNYSTGRGGTGNMARNDDPELARERQDVDVPPDKLAEGKVRSGRGGTANTYTPSDNEITEAKEHNEKIRKGSFKRDRSKEKGLKGLADKAKDAITGH